MADKWSASEGSWNNFAAVVRRGKIAKEKTGFITTRISISILIPQLHNHTPSVRAYEYPSQKIEFGFLPYFQPVMAKSIFFQKIRKATKTFFLWIRHQSIAEESTTSVPPILK